MKNSPSSSKMSITYLAIAVSIGTGGLLAHNYYFQDINCESHVKGDKENQKPAKFTAEVSTLSDRVAKSSISLSSKHRVNMSAPEMLDSHYNESSAPTTNIEIHDNEIKKVSDEPISTFSADADDGSYKLFKSTLSRGLLIDSDFVRTEEFINAFDYNYPSPDGINRPFSTHLKAMESPWSNNYLLKIGIKGYEYKIENLPPVNLTFLVDVSGSMRQEMDIIKMSLSMLADNLDLKTGCQL